jgi:dUTP pyrophosphatase
VSVLSRFDIEALLKQDPPLIEGYTDLAAQLQPNGFDISLRDVGMLQTPGTLAVSNGQRVTSSVAPLVFDQLGFVELMCGAYLITFNEIVHLPKNVMALGRPRSSLLRSGVNIGTAVWDTGYSGRSQALMMVYNQRGFRVEKNARVLQLVFFTLSSETEGYQGRYQGENIG